MTKEARLNLNRTSTKAERNKVISISRIEPEKRIARFITVYSKRIARFITVCEVGIKYSFELRK